ncbi:MAG: MFS transporter, partial [Planctomycetota bacterium]
MITYIDRVCFGAAAPQLASELSLSGVADLKWAFTAFAIAYSVCEIPTGWLGDALGPRSTLIR